jgi:hypothetical protein
MSNDGYIMIQSDKLLKYAKTIFGDVVVNAWVADDLILGRSAAIEAIYESSEAITVSRVGDLDWSNILIVFEFSNGKKVAFSNSEWASISAVGEKYKEVKL